MVLSLSFLLIILKMFWLQGLIFFPKTLRRITYEKFLTNESQIPSWEIWLEQLVFPTTYNLPNFVASV